MKSTSSSLASSFAPERLWRLAVFAFLGALALAAAGHGLLGIDPAEGSGWLPGCVFRALTDLPCPGCGMTHALLLLAQLRLTESLAAHPAGLPLVAIAAIWCLRPTALTRHRQQLLCAAALPLLLGLWVLRLPSS